MAPVIHGHNKRSTGQSRAYRSWSNMKQRCLNQKNTEFRNYGGRGVTVCERWQEFANFLMDMGERPKGMTLDRKDSNGNYSPENCQWADALTQSRGRRECRNRKLDIHKVAKIWNLKGSTKNEIIGKQFGVSRSTIAKIYRGELWVLGGQP